MGLDIINVEMFEKQNKNSLRTVADVIEFPIKKDILNIINGMQTKLYELGGVGLAAPQINKSYRIIIVYIPKEAGLLRDDVKEYPMHVLVNPKYSPVADGDKYKDYEACYSVSSVAGEVPRFSSINLEYYDMDGNFYKTRESGFYARVLQHEIDHLDGVLITDRFSGDCVTGTIEEITSIRRSKLSDDKKKLLDDYMQSKLIANKNS